MGTAWTEGSMSGGTTSDGWAYEHHFATGVSYAWRIGQPDTEIEVVGYGHDHAIFDLIAEQIIADEDREPVELRKAG